ncbi:MAG: ribokinase [Candidatus Anoxymicrobium japonicum]|uniref:Ribokinase n=1 Tax=Candidatus Anoxymicrobium japonicum TaxID=2013648 RepID=A0A2N3G532_9ACTN|nr:MAG: ribokinase [Candidatus Anoxymicrobium japonicum]
MAGTLVVGSIVLDMVITAPRIPEPGENVHGTGFSMVPGGKGANQAVAAARLGQDVCLLGCAGADAFGDYLVDSLANAGIDTSHVRRSDAVSTGVALIVVEETTGMNTIVVDPGANMALTVEDLDVLDSLYAECGTALFQLEIPLDVVSEGARRARSHGLTTVLDAGPPRGANVCLAKLFDVVSPNEKELASLTGREVRDFDEASSAAKELLDAGIDTLVVKMGEAGALLVTGEEQKLFPAFKVNALDSTGAGDAFTAGLVVALSEGMELDGAVRFANAAGAVAATAPGAQPSMPSRSQVERLLARDERP